MAHQFGGPTEVRVEVNKSSPVVWLKTGCRPISGCGAADRDPSGRLLAAVPLYPGDHAAGDRRRRLFIRIQNRPLVDLEHAALQVGRGIIPPPLREYGASEVRSVTRAFNHMAAGVKQLADDRTLLMAGSVMIYEPR